MTELTRRTLVGAGLALPASTLLSSQAGAVALLRFRSPMLTGMVDAVVSQASQPLYG